MSKPGNLRAADPAFAAFIDGLRDVFGADGAEEINANMREGMQGIPNRFHYSGPAGELGTPFTTTDPAKVVSAADLVLESINREKDATRANRNHRR